MSRLLLTTALCLAFLPGCVLGKEQDPGCRVDSECERGFVCRAGACLRYSTEAGPPNDPGDAGNDAAGDAPSDAAADAPPDAAADAPLDVTQDVASDAPLDAAGDSTQD